MIKVSLYKRLFTVYMIIGRTFGSWLSPIITGLLLIILRIIVFIGSNSSLVAPVTIDENSVVGAGSVITRNVKKKSLAITRSEQIEIKNYKRKK